MTLPAERINNGYSKTCLKRSLKRTKNCFQLRLSLNAGQKYCRMLQWEHSAILLTFIKLPFSIKTFVLSIFKWPHKSGLLYMYARRSSERFLMFYWAQDSNSQLFLSQCVYLKLFNYFSYNIDFLAHQTLPGVKSTYHVLSEH